ncbi:MAG: ABC transporter ATP-binding protein [Spirochaetales bacterium]|nr:ABC transporter ATP-binding protein [Spirochaetales bacterium]
MLSFIWKFRSFLRPFRFRLGVAVVTMVLLDAFGYVLPELVRYLTDNVYSRIHEPGMVRHMIIVCGFLLASALLRGLFSYTMIRSFWSVSESLVRDIRNALYDKIQHLELAFYDQARVGDLMSRITNDIQLIRNFFSWGIEHRLRIFLLTATIFVLMLILHWQLALCIYAVLPVFFLILLKYSKKMAVAVDRKQEQIGSFASRIQENLTGIRVVKAFAMEGEEIEKFTVENRELKERETELSLLQMYLNPLLLLLNGIGSMIIVVFGGYMVTQGTLTIGVLLGFMTYLGIMGWPVGMLAMNTSLINQAKGAGRRILEILESPDQKRMDTGTKTDAFKGGLAFKNVSFAYHDGSEVLEDINFTIEPGEKVAMFGLTGAGKSTLISLIPRFYPPTKGVIEIDGTDIQEWDLRSLRSQIGIVLQETFLFSTSIRENIAYGKPDAGFDEVRAAARHAQIDNFIMELPEGYDTIVGEQGIGLSGGQRQRIAIARTLLQDPKLLILDDCTSSLDAITEHKIQMQLKELMKGRTTIVISQRVAAFALVDRIIVMSKGTIQDIDSHSRLMKRNALYRDTYQSQVIELPTEIS